MLIFLWLKSTYLSLGTMTNTFLLGRYTTFETRIILSLYKPACGAEGEGEAWVEAASLLQSQRGQQRPGLFAPAFSCPSGSTWSSVEWKVYSFPGGASAMGSEETLPMGPAGPYLSRVEWEPRAAAALLSPRAGAATQSQTIGPTRRQGGRSGYPRAMGHSDLPGQG